MKCILSLFVFIVSCWGCSQNSDPQLKTPEQFLHLGSKPLYQKYGQVVSVKIVLDQSDGVLHFINSSEYQYHYRYCASELGYGGDIAQFNNECYSDAVDRRFLLGTINYYKALDKYALELGPSDRMNAAHLERLFAHVKKEVFFANVLFLMLNTAHVNSVVKESMGISFLTPQEVYNGQSYQPISKYNSKGRLLVINNLESQLLDIRPTDIIIIDNIPVVFPLVAGVIVTQFQTPLSHVSLLGHNRKIPICAYTEVFDDLRIIAMDRTVVSFKVEQDTFYVTPSTIDLTANTNNKKRTRLKKNTSVDTLIPAAHLKENLSSIVGNKAANFGSLVDYSRKLNFKTPEAAFAIPFAYYDRHIRKSGAASKIKALLDKDNLSRPMPDVAEELKIIREFILNTEVDVNLLKNIDAMILASGTYSRMRFRSSTNAEDRKGFSGAGLYASRTGKLGSTNKPIDLAIKTVWSSLWSYNAFMERESFNIDQGTVAMGILVHRSFPDEEVNGVAITTNLYRDNYPGFVVNAQLGDASVVAPERGIQCDQFICYPDKTTSVYGNEVGGIDIINYSSLNNGELVMTVKEIQALANTLELIKKRYFRKHFTRGNYLNFALDLEFKLDRETRELYIKQMRVYTN